MSRVLFIWELGFGLGHLMPLRQYCETLKHHTVFAAIKSLHQSHSLFKNTGVGIIQSPVNTTKTENPVASPACFAHLLHNNGFSSFADIADKLAAWRSLFDLVTPDLVFFDHAPSALLASRRYDFKKVLIGTGFTCPPIDLPLGVFATADCDEKEHLAIQDFEQQVLDRINAVLIEDDGSKLAKLSDIYAQAELTLISANPEMDHFYHRGSHILKDEKKECYRTTKYLGLSRENAGKKPLWPKIQGKKIFLYTHNFSNLSFLLQAINFSKQPTIVYSSSIHCSQLQQFASNSLFVADEPVDLNQVADTCDFAITNGNFNTSSQLLLDGVPLMTIPLQQEQLLFSTSIRLSGASLMADHGNRQHLVDTLQTMSDNLGTFKQEANKLKNKYARFDAPGGGFYGEIKATFPEYV